MLTARQQELARELPATDFFTGSPQEIYEKTQAYFRDKGWDWLVRMAANPAIVPWVDTETLGPDFYTAWNPEALPVIIPLC